MTFAELQTEPPRDKWGRYLISPATGKGKPVAHTRVTTIAKTLDDTSTLTSWKLRMAAAGLAMRPDLMSLAGTQLDNKTGLDRTMQDAIEAGGGSARANLGTALHALTEQADRGGEPTGSPDDLADIAAYRATLGAANITILPDMIEQLLVVGGLDEPIAGTVDRVVTIDGGYPMIADLKTGRSLDYAWLSMSIQLALYANATSTYDPRTSTHGTMPEVNKAYGLIVHLPAGEARCELHLVDLTIGMRAAQVALDVRALRKQKLISRPLELKSSTELADELAARRNDTQALIDECRTRGALDYLKDLWPEGLPTLKQSDEHSFADLNKIVEAAKIALAKLGDPF